MNLYIPVLIVVLSNTLYHICAKATPESIQPFATLTVTYAVGALVSFILYLVSRSSPDLAAEFRKVNWSSFALGLSIVGLEAGFLLMYKVGWSIGTAQIVVSAICAVMLLIIGAVFYREPITVKKAVGAVICLAGLYLLNQ